MEHSSEATELKSAQEQSSCQCRAGSCPNPVLTSAPSLRTCQKGALTVGDVGQQLLAHTRSAGCSRFLSLLRTPGPLGLRTS